MDRWSLSHKFPKCGFYIKIFIQSSMLKRFIPSQNQFFNWIIYEKSFFGNFDNRQNKEKIDPNCPVQILIVTSISYWKKTIFPNVGRIENLQKGDEKCRRLNLIHIAKINYTTLLKLKKKRFSNWNGDKLYDKCNWILHLFSQRV